MHKQKLAAVATSLVICGAASQLATASSAGTLALHAELSWQGGDGTCPAGTPSATECHPHPGGPARVPGLGEVTQQYSYPVVFVPPAPECRAVGAFNVADYTARLIVEGKGEIALAVKGISDCLSGPEGTATVINNTQSFTVTGGTGAYAGASGVGTVTHVAKFETGGRHAFGTDTWAGTLSVPSLEFDLTAPTISGGANKVVRAPRRSKTARVTFAVSAKDDVDGTVPVTCKPRSGSRFKLGKTRVTCSATDKSGNLATVAFTVTVKRTK